MNMWCLVKFIPLLSKGTPTLPEELTHWLVKIDMYLLLAVLPQVHPLYLGWMETEAFDVYSQFQ